MPPKPDILPRPDQILASSAATVRSILIEKGLPCYDVKVERTGMRRYVTIPWDAFAGLAGEGDVIGYDHG